VAHLARQQDGVVVTDQAALASIFTEEDLAERLSARRRLGRQTFTIERSLITRDLIAHDEVVPAKEAQP